MQIEEKSFIGIPKSDWLPELRFILVSMILYLVFLRVLPAPIGTLAYAWVVAGHIFLKKANIIANYHPRTMRKSISTFLMAAAWPYFCYSKIGDI